MLSGANGYEFAPLSFSGVAVEIVIPKKFRLMAHEWTVEHVPGMIQAADGDECRGLCEFDQLTIRINMAQCESMIAHTFLHEVMHAVLWSLGSKLTDNEKFVDSVAGCLAQVVQSAE